MNDPAARAIIALNVVLIAAVIAGAVVMSRQRDGPIVLPTVPRSAQVDPVIPQRIFIDI